jgi:hypothetical protein
MILVGNATSLTLRPGRLAVSADGNKTDRDDIGATPMALAILAKAGSTAKSKLVHYEYNDYIWGSNYYQKRDMTNSAKGAASTFGFSSTIFFSVIDYPSAAYNHLAAEINKSTYTNPLYILAMGPMASICEAIKRSYSSRRQYVTVISHSAWNESYSRYGSCTWSGIKSLGVKTIHITDQNAGLATNYYPTVSWIANSPDWKLRWVWSRMKIGLTFYTVADVSDAGEMWYWLKYDQYGNFSKLKSFFASQTCTAPTTNRTIKICSPANGSTVGSPIHFQAQVTDTASVYVKVYVDVKVISYAKSFDLSWASGAGTHHIDMDAWDAAGQFSASTTFTTQ